MDHEPILIHESWVKRNGLLFFPLLVFVVGIPVICCGAFAFSVGWFAGMVTAPKTAAIGALEQDSRVTEKIGIEISSNNQVNLSNLQVSNDNGSTEIRFTAIGSKGSARINGKMLLIDGEWSAERLVVTFDDGTELVIPEDVD